MTRTAAHRRPPAPLLSPGQRLALALLAAVAILGAVAFKYGTTDRNPLLDLATAATGVWTAATSWQTYLLAAGAVPAYRVLRNIITAPKGAHRYA